MFGHVGRAIRAQVDAELLAAGTWPSAVQPGDGQLPPSSQLQSEWFTNRELRVTVAIGLTEFQPRIGLAFTKNSGGASSKYLNSPRHSQPFMGGGFSSVPVSFPVLSHPLNTPRSRPIITRRAISPLC